jgi:hypothetical protein
MRKNAEAGERCAILSLLFLKPSWNVIIVSKTYKVGHCKTGCRAIRIAGAMMQNGNDC